MQISQRGIDLIVSFEGKKILLPDGRYKAYLDTLAKPPVPTIYCGLTRCVYMGMIITKEQGDIMFAVELGSYQEAMERLIKVPLNQNQWDAICSFTYNCGVGALEKSTLLRELNKGNYDAVPSQLIRWIRAGGKVWPGLLRRRRAESDLFMEPVPTTVHCVIPAADGPRDEPQQFPDDHMPQQVSAQDGSMMYAAKNSWTIRGALAAVASGIMQMWLSLFSTAKEAGEEIVSIRNATGPFDALFTSLKANMAGIAALIVIIGCSIAIVKRLQAARDGKQG